MKRKLLLAACLVASAVGMKAQTDVTATYLTNADFSSGTPIDNNVCTYGKDMVDNGTTYYGAQAIEGWTNASVGAEDSGYENSKLAGALFAYGSTPWLAGSGTAAPATDPNGNAGNAAGLCAVWGGSIQYTQAITLPAGSYTVRFKVYNATTNNGSGKFITTNLFGFAANGGTTYYAPNKTFAIGQWSTVAVTFNLTEETAGTISMGFVGPGGNANMPHLFVDNVKILQNTYYEDVTNKVGVAQASWTGASEMPGNDVTTDDGRTTKVAAKYGTSAAGTILSQTVSGLKKGTYEAVVYAYSQNEWNNYGASLTTDAGDVGYVLAEGTTTIKEWINARRGPGYPSDGPGIYTLSGIEVGDNGQLTLGYAIDKANQTEWHAIQIKSLIYTKNLDLSGFISAYETALASAKTTAAKEDKMLPSLKTTLNEVITTYDDGNVDKSDADALETATSALQEATANVENSITAYANAKSYLDQIEAILANTNVYTTDAYNTNYATPKEKYDNSTLTTEEGNALSFGTRVTGNMPALLLSAWTFNGTAALTATKPYMNTWSVEGNSDGSEFRTPFYEYWVDDGSELDAATIQAEMTGLTANQLYKVDVWARLRATNNKTFTDNGVTLQVNDGTVIDLTEATQIGSSRLYHDTFTAVGTTDADGKLTIKITVAASSGSSWLSFKNVKYAELDDERIPYAETLATTVANAKSLSETLVIPAGLKTALYNTANQYDGYTYSSLESVALFESAIAEVNTAISDAKEAETTYAKYTTLQGYVTTLLEVEYTELVADAHATLEAANTTPSITTKAELNDAYEDLYNATMTYVKDADPAKGKQFDLTFLLTNPDVTALWTGAWGVQPTGWYNEQQGGNFQVMANDAMGPNGEVFMEYWSETAASSGFVLCQKVTLPQGTYQMTGRVGVQQYDGKGETTNVTFSANDVDGTQIAFGALQDGQLDFVQSSAEPVEVKIGLKAQTGNNARWMGINNIHLYKVPANTVEIDEDADYTPESVAGTVTLKRTLSTEKWNTFVVPFQITNDELKAAFGAEVAVAEFSDAGESADAVTVSFNTMATPAITPNKPVLLKPSAVDGEDTYVFENRTVAAGTPKAAGTYIDFVGTYAATTDIAEGDYFIASDKLYKSAGATTIAGTRAYLKVKTAGAKVRMIIDDEATGIEGIAADAVQNGKVYDLSGRLVKNPTKGLYIQNGKKYFVK